MIYNFSINPSKNFEYQVTQFIRSHLKPDEESACDEAMDKLKNIRYGYRPDMVLPQGCKAFGWEKNTIIEVKNYLRFDTLQRIYPWMRESYSSEKYDVKLIYLLNLCIPLPQINDPHFQLLSKGELLNLAQKKPRRKGKKKTGSNSENEVIDYRRAFQERTCTLFVGAGVSQSAGLPGWQELLQRVAEKIISQGKSLSDCYFKAVEHKCSHSNIVAARYLEKLITEKLLAEGIQEDKIKEETKKIFVEYLKEAMYDERKVGDMNLVSSIVDLVRNNEDNIQSIITYNFDDLLEQEFEKKEEKDKKEMKAISFFDNNGIVGKGIFPIMHVHGILPQKSEHGQGNEIIISEDEYHELYNNHNSWPNVVQQYALQTTTCFFIGMSMSDPNLRRLLEAPKHSDEIVHYAFLKKADTLITFGSTKNEEVVKSMFRDLGVEIVWFDEFEDLPELIRKMGEPLEESADISTDRTSFNV